MNDVDELLLANFDVIHSGVPGMKWGVRRERRNQALARAGKKGADTASTVRAIGRTFNLHLGPVDLIKGRGLRGGAARKSTRVGAQLARRKAHESTVTDLIKRVAFTRMTDLIPVRAKNANKPTTHKADLAIVVAGGTLLALKILARQGQKRL